MTNKRIYKVVDHHSEHDVLVIAATQAEALRIVSGDRFKVLIPSTIEVAQMVAKGVSVLGTDAPQEQDELANRIAADMASMEKVES